MRFRKLLLMVMWCLLIAGVILLFLMIGKHKKNEICSAIKIQIKNSENNHFIDTPFVLECIHADQIIGSKISSIAVDELELELKRNSHIKNAEVYTDISGTLFISIWQRNAMARVINNAGESFYIDEENFKMPVSENYTARVLVCSGNINEKCTKSDTINSNTLKTCACIAQYVHKSSFWVSTIEQIFVTSDSVIVLVSKLGDLKIIFGDSNDIESKFNKLYTFYTEVLPKTGWEKYSSIDLSFKNQLIAKRK